MSTNTQTVDAYMRAFNELDHEKILACLTDDVEWIVPGAFHVNGKAAFDKEIENPAFEGKPQISTTRTIEAHDVVVVEGKVVAKKRGEEIIHLVFCDIFDMREGKIRRLTSYLAPDASP